MEGIKGQGGIQMLLTAEQEAQQIVSGARNMKMKRLRQAKEEAEREIENYRSYMEAEYQKNISETSGNSGSTAKQLEQDTQVKITNLKEKSSKVSKDVVGMLIKQVTTVKN